MLGPHRSGTSAVTRLLWVLGLDLGGEERMLPAREGDNEKGFYEHRGIMEVNEWLLRRMGGSWRDPPPLTSGWELDPELDDLLARGRQLIARDFAADGPWGFKDPRLSLTLPFWRRLLTPTAYVICQRSPLAVASSLERRNRIPPEHGVALWLRYTASAIVNTAGQRRLFIAYDELFSRRDAAVTELARLLESPSSRQGPELQAAIDAWLEEGLRHHAPSLLDTVGSPAMSAEALGLHLLAELAVACRESEPALRGAGEGGSISDALDALAAQILGVGLPLDAQVLAVPADAGV